MASKLVIEVVQKGVDKANRELIKLDKTIDKTDKSNGKMVDSFDKTRREMGKFGSEVKKVDADFVDFNRTSGASISSIGSVSSSFGALSAAVAASGAAIAATTIEMAQQVVEMDNMSRLASVSINEFTQQSFAAKQYGISVDQLSDAFKDAKERIGDFIATGGGPLQDFADVMNYTEEQTLAFAESVKDLSGRDVLTQMVSQLEAAGVSGDEMSFALEGMASDMTLLIPLLTNGGNEFDRLNQKMSAFTSPITDKEVENFRQLNESVDLLTGSFTNLLTKSVTPLIDPMTKLSEAVAFLFASMNEGTEAQLSDELADLVAESRSLQTEIKYLENRGYSNIFQNDAEEAERLRGRLAEVKGEIKSTQEELATLTFGTSNLVDTASIPAAALEEGELVGPVKPSGNVSQKIKDIEDVSEANQIAINDDLEGYAAMIRIRKEYEQATRGAVAADVEGFKTMDALRKEAIKNERQKAKYEQELIDQQTSGFDDLTSNLGAALGEQNGLYKAAAITNTTIATYQAATEAYKALAGVPVVGPALGIAASGAAIAAGLANVSAIQSARAQGGQVSSGSTYSYNEFGAEAFVPNVNGRVFSNSDLKNAMSGQSGGGTTVNIYTDQGLSVQSIPNDEGGEDVYVRRDELGAIMGQQAQNPNSELNQSLPNTWNLARR